MRACSSAVVTSASRCTYTASTEPLAPNSRCAVARSNAATVTAPRSVVLPYAKSPTISYFLAAPLNSTRTWSPTWNPCFSAVPASIAT